MGRADRSDRGKVKSAYPRSCPDWRGVQAPCAPASLSSGSGVRTGFSEIATTVSSSYLPGSGMDLWIIGLAVVGIAGILGAST
jgi:hypothetical protein